MYDLSVTISAVVAVCAIVSPILTAIINNIFQLKMKKIELKQEQYAQNVLYKKNIFENYLRYAGQCILYNDSTTVQTYAEYHFLAYLYAPEDLHSEMTELRNLIKDHNRTDAPLLLENISLKIRNVIETL